MSAEAVEVRRGLVFTDGAGHQLAGTLYLPTGGGPHPCLVAVHGGGWRNAVTDVYDYLGPWLAARGYAVFAITYRLASEKAKAFPEAVQDVRAAVQFVRTRASEFGIAADRVGLIGDSAGAHLAALVALAGDEPEFRGDQSDEVTPAIKVAVCVYGVFDLAQQWRHDQLARREQIAESFLGKKLIDDRRPFFHASPLAHVSARRNKTAFLLAWGTEDDVVDHRDQSLPFLEALKQAGYFVRTVIALGAPHHWLADPIDEVGSFSGFFAPRLLRFLQAKL